MLKKLFFAGIALALSGLLVVPVFAAERLGSGSIHCEGDGVVYLRGSGQVRVTGQRGFVAFKDLGGDGEIEVEGAGFMWQMPGGATVWFGRNGTADMGGSRIVAGLKGTHIVFDAEGLGQVWARGEGFCQAGTVRINWAGNLRPIELESQN